MPITKSFGPAGTEKEVQKGDNPDRGVTCGEVQEKPSMMRLFTSQK